MAFDHNAMYNHISNQQPSQNNNFNNRQNNNFNNNNNNQSRFQKQYNEKLYRVIGMNFPYNNLILVSLMKRVSMVSNEKSFDKESYIVLITGVLGVTNDSNLRTYDFNRKIVQKYSLKDLKSLAFSLKELGKSNPSILPYTKFTNSGEGSKSLYLQYREYNPNNKNSNAINFGFSWRDIKINTQLTKYDAYAIGECLDKIYEFGIRLEFEEQASKNLKSINFNSNEVSNENLIPTSQNGVLFPTVPTAVCGNKSKSNLSKDEEFNSIMNNPQMQHAFNSFANMMGGKGI